MRHILSGSCYSLLVLLGIWSLTAPSSRAETPREATPLILVQPGTEPTPVLTQRAITIVGLGQVAVPADRAILEFRLGSRNSLTNLEAPGLSLGSPVAQPEMTLQPVLRALEAIGVTPDRIEIQSSPLEDPKLLVTLLKPVRQQVQQVVATVNQSVNQSNQLFLQSIGAAYTVNNCLPLEQAARRIALADARRQITPLAQELRVQVGEILLVTVQPLQGSAASLSCGSKVGVGTSSSLLTTSEDTSLPPYNPGDLPEVRVRSQISVTYGIKK